MPDEPLPRRLVTSGAPWEASVGYSRAVRIGDTVAVSGTTSTESDDAYQQARAALRTFAAALAEAGARLEDVIRTRLFVIDIERDGEAVGRAHAEIFGEIRPAATMLEVRRLIDPRMRVEIEADAVLAERREAAR